MQNKFEAKVNDFIKNFDYESFYNEIDSNPEYDLYKLLDLIAYMLIYMELNRIDKYNGVLSQYLGVLRDPEVNTTITKPQLLYLIYRCYEISKITPTSPNINNGMYL